MRARRRQSIRLHIAEFRKQFMVFGISWLGVPQAAREVGR
jgi:hypothetical protein